MKVFSREFTKEEQKNPKIVILKLTFWEEVQNNFNFFAFIFTRMFKHYVLKEPIGRINYYNLDE